jgi:hypothetical protein
MAFLEAASVHAFKILRDELRHHGAPRSLIRAAERAARDERRHARAAGALARRYGTRAAAVYVPKRAVRSIEAIAVENAAAGCVQETYGALVATYQAQAAEDPVVRAAMMRIARDETRHASLSWKVMSWLNGRLDTQARARVRDAMHEASAEVARHAMRLRDPELARVAGLPSGPREHTMVQQMASVLWA